MPPSYVQRCREPKANKFALGNAPTRPNRILRNEAFFELLEFKTVIQQLRIRFLVGTPPKSKAARKISRPDIFDVLFGTNNEAKHFIDYCRPTFV
jgi:hypothetical protein